MKNDFKYRIVEYCGEFTIQILAYEEKGILWWKRKEWNWERTNIWGGVLQPFPISQPLSKTFKSLKKAKQQVIDWKTDAIYHYDL